MGPGLHTPGVPTTGAVVPISVAWVFAGLARPCSVPIVLIVVMVIIGCSMSATTFMTLVFKVTGDIALLAGPLVVLTVGLCQGIKAGFQSLSIEI